MCLCVGRGRRRRRGGLKEGRGGGEEEGGEEKRKGWVNPLFGAARFPNLRR